MIYLMDVSVILEVGKTMTGNETVGGKVHPRISSTVVFGFAEQQGKILYGMGYKLTMKKEIDKKDNFWLVPRSLLEFEGAFSYQKSYV